MADNSRVTPKDIILDAIEDDIGANFAFEDDERETLRRLRQSDLFLLQRALMRVKRTLLKESEET